MIIHSGGAEGADSVFGKVGAELGCKVLHHSFKGHKGHSQDGQYIVHDNDELASADSAMVCVNRSLGRTYPPNSDYVRKLLQRNFFQVKNAKTVVAVAKLEKSRKLVSGGTGWATQLGVDLFKDVFVFDDGQTNRWYKFSYKTKLFELAYEEPDQNPEAVFPIAGIGTREITEDGANAIYNFLQWAMYGNEMAV